MVEVLKNEWPPNLNRYKILVSVFVGEKRHQGVNIAAQCLCDQNRDHVITTQVQTSDYFILVICCGLYHDWSEKKKVQNKFS